jgi:hypothetical protein
VPLNILPGLTTPFRNDNSSSFAYASKGDGSTPQEQYISHNAASPTDTKPIQPGATYFALPASLRGLAGLYHMHADPVSR